MANLYYVAPDFSLVIPEHCPDETYIYVEAEMDSELAETTPIDSYGSDRDLAGWTAYNIASNTPVTVEALEALQADLEQAAASQAMNPEGSTHYGFMFDSREDTYTPWEDLDPEFQDEVMDSMVETGEYNDDPYWFYPASLISLIYASSVKATIAAIAKYEATNA